MKALITAILMALPSLAFSATGQHFDRVIFVILENANYQSASKQPYLSSLAANGVQFTQFSAETHPSQGNYIALTSGALNGVYGDGVYNLRVAHIGDLLEARGLTWKVYAEDYPGGCDTRAKVKHYVRKHNPFISYVNVQSDPIRCANIVDAIEFDSDAASGKLPNYIFYVPNLRNDGHDTGVAFADKWYHARFAQYFNDSNFMAGTLVVTTFDESDGFGNQIYTSLWGPMIQPQQISASFNHYSLLKMVEENWGLGNLGLGDASAPSFPNIWLNFSQPLSKAR